MVIVYIVQLPHLRLLWSMRLLCTLQSDFCKDESEQEQIHMSCLLACHLAYTPAAYVLHVEKDLTTVAVMRLFFDI